MRIKDLISPVEALAPLRLQESYDNSGLIIGSPEHKVNKALVCLDITEAILKEAKDNECDVIIAHHPLIFKPLSKITGTTETERAVIAAIKNDIAVYAAHTNLDIAHNGVNTRICEVLGIEDPQPLAPKEGYLRKLVTFVPNTVDERGTKYTAILREALTNAGAGETVHYDACTFSSEGTGTYRAKAGSKPYAGEINKVHSQHELRIETIFPVHKQNAVLEALKNVHPYEEVAYDIYELKLAHPDHGPGMIGTLPEALDTKSFLSLLKEKINCECLRHSNSPAGHKIKKVAVCGGSGANLSGSALQAGADAFVTSDIKYHQFFEVEEKMLLVDAGHFESEAYTIDLLYDTLRNNFPNFAVHKTKVNTNPINYF